MLDIAVRMSSCLLCLAYLDSDKLVRLKDLLLIIASGALAAGASLPVNLTVIDVVAAGRWRPDGSHLRPRAAPSRRHL